MSIPPDQLLTRGERIRVLIGGFLAWMFAGLEISLFILIHRQMTLGLLGSDTSEEVVRQGFVWFQAAFLFGAAAGGWHFGWLGDRIGRTRAMGASVLCYSLFALACYFVTDADTMLVVRFLACLGIGGVWPNAVALVAEAWPNASRPFLAGLLGAAANVGFVLLGVIGYCFPITDDAWRWTFLVGASPAVIGLLILLIVPESPRWLASRIPKHETQATSPLREVLTPPLLSRTILGVMLGAIPVVGSAANANWLIPWTDHAAQERAREAGLEVKKPDARSKAKTQITRSGGAVFGSLLGGIIASVLGRRISYFFISLGALAASSYIFSQLDPLHPQFQVFTFILGFVGITYFGWLPLFLPELFPTRVRSTGTGISFNSGRVVAALVVLSAGFLLDQFSGDYARVGFWSGMIYAVGMLVIWFVPRKTGGRLED
ncbi:MAG: MFS transporter [Planctomycetia bacterium]|nr:MFS transporter [Planctomycetia bacterium]